MKNLKFIYSLLVVLVAGAFASCTNDMYTPGEVPAGPQVSFSNGNDTVKQISGEEADNTQYITLTRIDTKGALEVPINVVFKEGEEDNAKLFEIPESVIFEDGKGETLLAIKANSAQMEEDKEYSMTLNLLLNNQTTPYGDSTWTVAFRLFPWNRIKGELNDYAKFRGGDIFSVLDGNKFVILSVNAEVEVEAYEHKSKDGVFLVKNPWAKAVVPVLGHEEKSEEELSTAAYHLKINCENPEKCYIEKQRMGLATSADSDWYIASDYHPVTNPNGIAGVLEGAEFDDNGRWKSGGVITWPKEGLLISSPGYKADYQHKSNLGGGFRVILPDGVATDYTLGVSYEGSTIASDMSDVKAKFLFTHGADVKGIKYYLADGNVLADPTAAIQALITGTANNICKIEDFNAGSEQTEININIHRADIYTIIAAPMDSEEVLMEKFVALDSFFYSGMGSSNEYPVDLTVEFGEYKKFQTDIEGDDIGDYNAFSYTIKGSNLKSLSIGCWPTAYINEYLAVEGNTYEKLFKEEGVEPLSLEELQIVQSAEGKVDFYGDLEDNTAYTAVVFAINNYETRRAEDFEFTTVAAPAYGGDFKVGKYVISGSDTLNGAYETVFEIQSYQGSAKKFLVSNIGYNDGAEWFATYDAEAGTLTLDGTVRGRKKEGNLFGKLFGYIDDAKTLCYQYESTEKQGGVKFDPLVFNIDKSEKAPIGILNYRFKVGVYEVDVDKNGVNVAGSPIVKHECIRTYGNNANTTITPYVEKPATDDNTGSDDTVTEN